MDHKKTEASRTTITRDKNRIDAPTGNLYESLAVLTQNDSLEEIFENKEQIEVSRFYESLPKPTAIAMEEWLNDRVYFRRPENQEENS